MMECDENQENKNWKGTNKSALPRSFEKKLFPSLTPCAQHTILFRIPIDVNSVPEAYPKDYHDTWDYNHVKMPCSKYNLLDDSENNSKKKRWDVITDSLLKPILSSEQLEKAILSYNPKYKERWKFHLLHSFFNEFLCEEETEAFFNHLLLKIIKLALQLPLLVTNPLPLLKQNRNHSISLSQLQIACLLANAFLCTFPHRNRGSEYSTYPLINFNELFQLKATTLNNNYLYEKLKCMIAYFKKVTDTNSNLNGIVTYSRRCLSDSELPYWLRSTNELTNLHITSDGTIEDDGDGMLQVDFANKYIGGGVLGHGSVQEEIRFLICPELLVSQLFSEHMLAKEAILISGVERFSNYSGYANSFEWDGVHTDVTPTDGNNRRYCTVMAIDAYFYGSSRIQYFPKYLRRELNKAYVGFSWGENSECSNVSIATGNWGCGAFRGDCHLKSLLQLMSAAQAKRDVAYFTFGDIKLRDSIFDMYTFLKNKKATVGKICQILLDYNTYLSNHPLAELYPYIYNAITNDNVQKGQNDKILSASVNCNKPIATNVEEHCLSPDVIESTPEKLEEDLKSSIVNCLEAKNSTGKQESEDVKFLPVNQFRLSNDEERTMCIKQQKNSWLQLNDSKKDFESVIEKPSQSLSTLKRDREECNGEKRVKRKISDYFSPKS